MIQLLHNVFTGKELFGAWLISTTQTPDLTSIAALTGLLSAFFMLAKQLLTTTNKYIPSYRKEPKLLLSDHKERITSLYQRIHNIPKEDPSFPGVKPNAFRQYTNPDNLYNQAIKLIRGGMDTQALVDSCKISMGEAQLLSAMYAQPQTG